MSNWTEQNDTQEPVKPDFTMPIARPGEQQFGCILRNRSGIDAGNIDYGARMIDTLSNAEQQDVCDMAYALYQSFCRQTGKVARQDGPR
jgi:hypothetical protein